MLMAVRSLFAFLLYENMFYKVFVLPYKMAYFILLLPSYEVDKTIQERARLQYLFFLVLC